MSGREPIDCLREVRASGANDAVYAENLTGPYRERDIFEFTSPSKAAHLEPSGAIA